MRKLVGYQYEIVELAPSGVSSSDNPWWLSFRHIDLRDKLEDAQEIINTLEKSNYNFTVYAIQLRPVYHNA